MKNKKNILTSDLEVLKNHQTPISNKISFKNTNIYISKVGRFGAKIVHVSENYSFAYNELVYGKNDFGLYHVYAWYDERSNHFLKAEINHEVGKLGVVESISSFTPSNQDLINIQCKTKQNNWFFYSAKEEIEFSGKALENINKKSIKDKIKNDLNIDMQEIIPIGKQGQAIHGVGNYIIEGQAGTGKTTVVLHKIKILIHQNNIPEDKILVLVKEKSIISKFQKLLRKINISNIEIKEFNNYINKKTTIGEIKLAEESSLDNYNVLKKIRKGEYDKPLIERLESCGFNRFGRLLNFEKQLRTLPKMKDIMEREKNENPIYFKEKLKILKEVMKKELISKFDLDSLKNTKKIKNALELMIEGKTSTDKEVLNHINNIDRLDYLKEDLLILLKKTNEYMSLNISKTKQNTIEDLFIKYNVKIKKDMFLSERNIFIKKSSELVNKSRLEKIGEIKKIKCEIINMTLDLIKKDNKLSYDYLIEYIAVDTSFNEIRLNIEKEYNTIIIDEAQTLTKTEIENTRVKTKQLILSGDLCQRKDLLLEKWDSLLMKKNKFLNDKNEINKYSLVHNFRQTYELAQVSYNYRELMKKRNMTNIEKDYFENEKGFNKPVITTVNKDKIMELIKDKISFTEHNFQKKTPVIIFYQNGKFLNRMKEIINNYNKKNKRLLGGLFNNKKEISFQSEEKYINESIIFVDINKISGKEYPVVIALLTKNNTKNNLYIILSRAQYDLTLIKSVDYIMDSDIQRLIDKKMIIEK
jgi:hypothetical protein